MKKLIPFFLSLLILAGCAKSDEYVSGYRQIGMDEAISMMEEENNYIILDVRTPEEFEEKHIPGAGAVHPAAENGEKQGSLP